MKKIYSCILVAGIVTQAVFAQKNTKNPTGNSSATNPSVTDSLMKPLLNQVNFRMIGPATTSGRIVDIAVNPSNNSEYYIATGYGGVWKTSNGGVTYNPIFDNYGTQSIGCLAIDPKNTHVLWVGTGENNNQRSVGYGNGIYKSLDGGKSFQNMGLKLSEHIGMIKIDPTNSNRVWVAAYGPVWKEGGDRGLYLTEDGGKTWTRVHHISDKTGCNEIHIDPNLSGTLYATFHQRIRHEWTYLGGGPESGLFKSTDHGKTWRKLAGGLPSGDLGRITVATSSHKAGLVYAMVEAEEGKGGIYVSYDYGESWTKQNGYFTAGNYYQEIYVDPTNANRLFILDTYLKVSDDGGKTLKNAGESNKHVDNHAIWVNPQNPSHWLVGCDGGLYETFDNAQHWDFKDNISITQFYRVSVDNATPFYNIYGGTQDNNTLGGPSRTNSANGIGNDQWFVTVGGDGFKSQVDPSNPNIVYSQWQYGGLVRYDKVTGEAVDIKPTVGIKDAPLRWNWDAPLIISRSNPSVLYFAANRVFKSEDRGNSWKAISGDLSRGIDRNTLPVMGKVWGVNAVVKNQSTSIYGNITSLSEGKNGEIYAGTDDGMVWKKDPNSEVWLKCGVGHNGELMLPGAPVGQSNGVGHPFVSMVYASPNSGNVYLVLDHHRFGDFKPYVYKSSNNGASWVKITTGLPENGPVKTVIEDFKDPDIVLVGTEFGLFLSVDGGQRFISWQGGLPPIAIKDMVFQEREDDLVVATFGRGFAVCDEYQNIREFKSVMLNGLPPDTKSYIFPVSPVKLFIPSTPLGGSGNGYKGASRFSAPNPAVGATIYYRIEHEFSTIEKRRKKRETDAAKSPNSLIYPAKDSIVAESFEQSAQAFMVIRRSNMLVYNNIVAKFPISISKGLSKVEWNLRYSDPSLPVGSDKKFETHWGPYVTEGTYYADIEIIDNSQTGAGMVYFSKGDQVAIEVKYLYTPSIAMPSKEDRQNEVARIFEVKNQLMTFNAQMVDVQQAVNSIKNASQLVNTISQELAKNAFDLQQSINKIKLVLEGNSALAGEEFETTESLNDLYSSVYYSCADALIAPTKTHMQKLGIIEAELVNLKKEMDPIINQINFLSNKYPELRIPRVR